MDTAARIKECKFYHLKSFNFKSVILCFKNWIEPKMFFKNILLKLPLIFGVVAYWRESESFNEYKWVICDIVPFHGDGINQFIYMIKLFEFQGNFANVFRDRSVGGGCSLENAEVVPKHMCDGKRNCWVYHNLFHRDPCPTKVKYSVINYICEWYLYIYF